MPRLIDADALIEYLKEMWGKWDEDDWYEAQAKDAMQDDIRIVEKQPTVDAVPVVRCKECYYKDEKRIMDEDALWCRKHHMYVTADWFCADGEQ